MATNIIQQSNGQGALFELVARGNKDKFFVQDSNESTFPYDGRYESSCHHLAERRRIVPLNQTKFGSTFEVEIDAYGDILTDCNFEINLPSWIPQLPLIEGGQPVIAEKVNKLCWISDSSGNSLTNPSGYSYGYVNNVAYFLFERIQFYQDQMLIQDWSGDGLLAKTLTEGSWNSSFLTQVQAGLTSDNSPYETEYIGGKGYINCDEVTYNPIDSRAVALRATPGLLRLRLPLPGIQCPKDGGFPLIAAQHQTFRIKATLRRLEDLVVAVNNLTGKYDLDQKPTPWNQPLMYYRDISGTLLSFQPLPFIEIGQPTILLSTVQQYVPPTVQAELRSSVITIPFRRQFENIFTFGELDYKPLDINGVGGGNTAIVTRRLDGRHPTERLFFFFRDHNSITRNQLDNFVNNKRVQVPTDISGQQTGEIYNQFYSEMKLVIAGKDREEFWGPDVLDTLNAFCKDERDSGYNIGSMKWSLGEKYGTLYPAPREPEGTVNFTTADRPTLHINLNNINPSFISKQRQSEMRVITEGWAIYEFREGRGRLMFAN